MGSSTQEQRLQMVMSVRSDLPIFSASCLAILDKSGQRVPLLFNRAQAYVHQRIEEQRTRTGKVRALVLKGRQQGVSTYVAARLYQKTSLNTGKRALIMAHEAKASSNLFKMVKRYDENNPLAPTKGATNAQELIFGKLDSGYKVATAGSKDTGRSLTAQYLHASEFGFWDNAQSHLAGIGNAIGDIPDTEIIIESTGNGLGNAFHLMWQAAERGDGEYIAIFVPWWWQDEYRATVPDGFTLSTADELYQRTYGLSLEQMAWRANKIATYGLGFEWLFDQEYPATPNHAFKSPTANPLIPPDIVANAMTSEFRDRYGVRIIACDPAEFGDDRTAIVHRHGRIVHRLEAYEKRGPMEVTGMLANYWNELRPDALVVDRIGIGSGIVDRLRELQIPVIGINSAERAEQHDTYANRRAEMWWRMKDWFEDTPCRIPNDMALASDLSAPGYKHNSNGLKLLESKEDMRKRGIRSPDCGDALALTFAVSVAPATVQASNSRYGSSGAVPATSAGY